MSSKRSAPSATPPSHKRTRSSGKAPTPPRPPSPPPKATSPRVPEDQFEAMYKWDPRLPPIANDTLLEIAKRNEDIENASDELLGEHVALLRTCARHSQCAVTEILGVSASLRYAPKKSSAKEPTIKNPVIELPLWSVIPCAKFKSLLLFDAWKRQPSNLVMTLQFACKARANHTQDWTFENKTGDPFLEALKAQFKNGSTEQLDGQLDDQKGIWAFCEAAWGSLGAVKTDESKQWYELFKGIWDQQQKEREVGDRPMEWLGGVLYTCHPRDMEIIQEVLLRIRPRIAMFTGCTRWDPPLIDKKKEGCYQEFRNFLFKILAMQLGRKFVRKKLAGQPAAEVPESMTYEFEEEDWEKLDELWDLWEEEVAEGAGEFASAQKGSEDEEPQEALGDDEAAGEGSEDEEA
ncbi:hypothetical protein B0T14DRAFT_600995 [Immersiella caudata]|uniref:Uncharacterized protein n=1 Tax=Immersiella caudata TaxID=314043 RepID=A0AA40C894_9PEZI|nr:hypothetical protein B0T14DRAFT_600995 [Immersiella caudata]